VVALLLIAWLLSHSSAGQARDAGIAATAGLLIYFAPRMAARAR
jgi:hypothetical protein